MPLIKKASTQAKNKNMKALTDSGFKPKKAQAIASQVQKKVSAKKKGAC